MEYPVNPDGSFIYDHPQPTPSPERIWHVDGILAPFDKSTTLDGSRVTYATTPTAAAEKVLTACRKMRGDGWGWLGLVRVHPHYAWTDPDCPVCKRRASKKYPEAIDTLYEPVTITPQRLADEQAGYDAPSEAAMAMAEQLVFVGFEGGDPILVMSDTGVLCVSFPSLERAEKICSHIRTDYALALDQFAAKAVEERVARIVEKLESGMFTLRERDPHLTYNTLRNREIEAAIGIIRKP